MYLIAHHAGEPFRQLLTRILLLCLNYSYKNRLQVHVCGVRHIDLTLSNMAKNSVQRILGNSNNLSAVAIAIARVRSMLLRNETRRYQKKQNSSTTCP